MTSTARTVSLITTLLGALILAAVFTSAALPAVGSSLAGDREASTASGGIHTAAVDDVTTLYVDSRSSDVHVAFGDVSEAQLSVSPADSNAWHWTTAGNALIATNERPFYNICFGWCGNENEEVTITLPEELDGKLSGDFTLGSGRVTAEGDFTNLDLDVSAGTLTYTGEVEEVTTDLSGGSTNLELTNTRVADLEVAAGRFTAELDGRAPERVRAELSAGELNLTLPDVPFQVRTEHTFGILDNQLRTAPDADHLIDIEVVAGRALLQHAE